MTEQLKAPDPLTVAPQPVMEAPPLIVVVMVTSGVKPAPVTVTETPLGPWSGESVIDWLVMVKVAVALSKLPSDPVALTV